MLVLLVSPSGAARRLMQLFLERSGYTCVLAEDEDDALAQLQHHRVTAAVVDARAPNEDMLVFLGLLGRRHPSLPRLVLRRGRAELWWGSGPAHEAEGMLGFGADLPAQSELQRAVTLLVCEQLLRVLQTPVASA